jgi:hypothetical protein
MPIDGAGGAIEILHT